MGTSLDPSAVDRTTTTDHLAPTVADMVLVAATTRAMVAATTTATVAKQPCVLSSSLKAIMITTRVVVSWLAS